MGTTDGPMRNAVLEKERQSRSKPKAARRFACAASSWISAEFLRWLVKFGPPRALSPHAAASVFAKGQIAARALLPISLSPLSERVVGLSLRAPPIRRRRDLESSNPITFVTNC